MYKNAEQDDLWQTMTEQSLESKPLPQNATVKEIMDTWTLQIGFPVVTARRQANDELVIDQERYLLNRESPEKDQTLW